jgi:hypothetical protein
MTELALSQRDASPTLARELSGTRAATGTARLAVLPLAATATLVAALLVAFAGGYGYHRDELYFLAAGQHLAWGYPDQGLLTPLIAHMMRGIAPGSLTVLRLPSALMLAAVVFTTGLIAFELGGARRAQIIACACAAVSSVVLVVGHLLSTTTFDLFAWTLVCWLVIRTLRTGEQHLWLGVGFVGGLALLNKPLIAVFLLTLGLALLVVGPRRSLQSRWLWLGAVVALALWAPWLLWQAQHGWPQLHISSAIANGRSASSQPRWAFLPYELLLVSPVLAPVWIAGLVDLLRGPHLRRFRSLGFTWVVLAALFLAAGGKPYYLAGMFPVLIAAGSLRTAVWTTRGRRQTRSAVLAACIGLSGVVSALIALPVLPAHDDAPFVKMNADVGETIGWPELVRGVQRAYGSVGGRAVILTANYGEAGAIDRYGPALGLPAAYSGHNGFAEWGPPPERFSMTIAVGFSETSLRRWFGACTTAGRVRNDAGISNQEDGARIEICSEPRLPWPTLWPSLRHLS